MTPTGRARYSAPEMQFLRQAHAAEEDIKKLREVLIAQGFAVVGDEAFIETTADYTYIEQRLMRVMQGDK